MSDQTHIRHVRLPWPHKRLQITRIGWRLSFYLYDHRIVDALYWPERQEKCRFVGWACRFCGGRATWAGTTEPDSDNNESTPEHVCDECKRFLSGCGEEVVGDRAKDFAGGSHWWRRELVANLETQDYYQWKWERL